MLNPIWGCFRASQNDGQSAQQHHITVLGFKGSAGMPDSYVGMSLKPISGGLDVKTIPGKYRGCTAGIRDQFLIVEESHTESVQSEKHIEYVFYLAVRKFI